MKEKLYVCKNVFISYYDPNLTCHFKRSFTKIIEQNVLSTYLWSAQKSDDDNDY